MMGKLQSISRKSHLKETVKSLACHPLPVRCIFARSRFGKIASIGEFLKKSTFLRNERIVQVQNQDRIFFDTVESFHNLIL